MRHNNYLRLATVRRSAARNVEQCGRRYKIAIMSDVNCNVSDETLQYCKEFLEKYPEAPNWNKTIIILRATICSVARHIEPFTCHIALRHTLDDVILVKRSMIRGFS